MRNLKQQFDQEGFVIVRQVIEPAVVHQAREALASLVDVMARGLYAMDHIHELYEHEPFETRMIKLFSFAPDLSPSGLRHNLHLTGMFGLFFCPEVLDLVEDLLGPEIRLYPNYTARPKMPDDPKTLVLWHQDARYTENCSSQGTQTIGVNELRMVNVWSPLVPARPENGCMQFIPRTHKLGVVRHDHRQIDKLTFYLEITAEELQPRLKEVVDVVCDPGDVVLFSNLLFHCGQPNRTDMIRWSCDWRYQDATQQTLRPESGHLARSRAHPERIVGDAQTWAGLSFT